MWRRYEESDEARAAKGVKTDWTRRELLASGAVVLGGLAIGSRSLAADEPYSLNEATRAALGESPLVYISPLHANGKESSCHGEVWYFVDGDAVVIVTAADRWKARAIRGGRDRARLWVGDFGPAWRAGKSYRKAPTFVARAEIDEDRAVFDRLMAAFAERYADDWAKWKPRFEKGYSDGSRLLLRYTPVGA